ncbi:hypothetical protein HaLaN_29343 [Haematococcus lacustris]|uniref:Uncharacterized protein n=1 Tax=Haematococcus lacustris TaxID=44745 RepID=A0A6A0AF44_HAELA|nr:hypothetical protein HaLaN_29343 [Haematococcus lacustris]
MPHGATPIAHVPAPGHARKDLLLGNIRSSHQQLLELRLRLAELQPAARDPKNIIWCGSSCDQCGGVYMLTVIEPSS